MATLSYISFLCVIIFVSAFPDRVILPANNGPPSVVVVKQPVQPGRQGPQTVVVQPGRQVIQQVPVRPIAPQPPRPVVVAAQPGQKVLVVQKPSPVVVLPSRNH